MAMDGIDFSLDVKPAQYLHNFVCVQQTRQWDGMDGWDGWDRLDGWDGWV